MSVNTIFIILLTASILSALVPIGFGILNYKAFNHQLKALFVYLIISFFTEVSMFTLQSLNYNVLPSQFAFTIFEFLIIVYLYWLEFTKKTFRLMITLFVLSFIIAIVILFCLQQPIDVITDIASDIEAVIIIIFSIIFFFKALTDLQIPNLTQYPFFWLNAAFLMYFGTAFFLYLFNNTIKHFNETIIYFLAAIRHIINITFNILLAIGICKVKKI